MEKQNKTRQKHDNAAQHGETREYIAGRIQSPRACKCSGQLRPGQVIRTANGKEPQQCKRVTAQKSLAGRHKTNNALHQSYKKGKMRNRVEEPLRIKGK